MNNPLEDLGFSYDYEAFINFSGGFGSKFLEYDDCLAFSYNYESAMKGYGYFGHKTLEHDYFLAFRNDWPTALCSLMYCEALAEESVISVYVASLDVIRLMRHHNEPEPVNTKKIEFSIKWK